ncbi:MAG: ribonuclease P protein component [Oscillospiraceae bacterium]
MLYTVVLNQNKDFQLCYHKGKCIVSKNIIIYAKRNRMAVNRLGITTGKKLGNAVCRSRARRLIRQAWRENEIDAPIGLDIVIVARPHLLEVQSNVLSYYMKKYGIPALHQVYSGT